MVKTQRILLPRTLVNWNNIIPHVRATGLVATASNVVNSAMQQFYRVMVVPPHELVLRQTNLISDLSYYLILLSRKQSNDGKAEFLRQCDTYAEPGNLPPRGTSGLQNQGLFVQIIFIA